MHIGHVALRTPDLDRSKAYASSALGLSVTGESAEEVLLSANEKHHELQLLAGDRAGLDHVGLELESESELEAVAERAVAAGARTLAVAEPEPGLKASIRLAGPADITYELYTGMVREPLRSDAFLRPGIRRLGHLTFFAASPAEIVEFWVEGLGFRVSDQTEGVTWLRCDFDHHGLAVGPREAGTVLHHHAWEVQDVGALAQYCDSLGMQGKRLLWGPVRHGPGFNLATYLPDPDGGLIEVYTDLVRIYDEQGYEPVDWSEVPDALNLWGPAPPEEIFDAGVPVLPA